MVTQIYKIQSEMWVAHSPPWNLVAQKHQNFSTILHSFAT